jgi:hypothetical protein
VSLRVVRHDTARALLERAETWLLRAEDLNNLILSLAYAVAEEEAAGAAAPDAGPAAPFFASVEASGRVVGCAFRTPPHQLLMTEMPPEGAVTLARHLGEVYRSLPAVLGPPALAEFFAREWRALEGAVARRGADQRLYRLDEVMLLDAPGGMRQARLDEVGLAAEWAEGFARDVHARFGPGAEALGTWIGREYVFFWEDKGTPVSMAVAHGRTPRGVRVGYVYTPPERRRRGYAGALVAALSRHLLASGFDFCVLYADLSNPTTNALYQRMGYRPLCDTLDYHFDVEALS